MLALPKFLRKNMLKDKNVYDFKKNIILDDMILYRKNLYFRNDVISVINHSSYLIANFEFGCEDETINDLRNLFIPMFFTAIRLKLKNTILTSLGLSITVWQ